MSIHLYRFVDKETGANLGWAFGACEKHLAEIKIPDHAVLKKEPFVTVKCYDCVRLSYSEKGHGRK